jgi:hypothetical protein
MWIVRKLASRACFCVICFMVGTTNAAFANSWTHPDSYFNCPGYGDFIQRCDSTEGWVRAELYTQLPDGRLVTLEALKSDVDDGYFIHCDADMRWVVHSQEATLNLSESLVQGFNGGSLDFVWDDHIHSMGGYGLWRRHFDLIRFHGGPQAWQLVAPTGDVPQIRDVDQTQAFFAGGKAFVFVDNVAAEGGYDASNYILYELDVTSRHWKRLGLVDARLGMFQEVHAMKQGALILNRAGEMIWLDFKDVSAKLLMNRAVAFESFRNWTNEIGRVTFHADSSLWQEFEEDRFSFAIPWLDLEGVESFPIVSSALVAKALTPLASVEQDAEVGGFSWGAMAIILFGALGLTGMLVFTNRTRSTEDAGASMREGAMRKGELSALARKLVALQGQHFETEALDDLLDIAHISSPETLRSQRARLLQRVNTEYRVLEGVDLVVRTQSPNDRRRSVYRIGVSPQK